MLCSTSSLFELTPLTAFADDKQIMEQGKNLEMLIRSMEGKLEMITRWLKDSGLVVNCLVFVRFNECCFYLITSIVSWAYLVKRHKHTRGYQLVLVVIKKQQTRSDQW